MDKDEWIKYLATAALVLAEAYAVQPWKFPVFAWFWDFIARVCGRLANSLGWISVNARANYFMAVTGGN
jgi:hypothetical protein